MGGGAMLPAVMAAAGAGAGAGAGSCGATHTRSTSLAAKFHWDQSLSVISRTPCIPSSSKSTGLAEACRENLPSFDVADNLGQNSFEVRQNIAATKPYYDLEPVPTRMEAQKAIADLQRYMQSETNRESRMLQPGGYRNGRLHDALNVLGKDPSMQSTVASISCDKAVWDAILSNSAVQRLHGSFSAATDEKIQSITEELDIVDFILKYLTGVTKSKVMELIEKFGALVAEIFKPAYKEKPTSELDDLMEEKIRSSMLLSVVIILIVIVTRN